MGISIRWNTQGMETTERHLLRTRWRHGMGFRKEKKSASNCVGGKNGPASLASVLAF